MLAAGPLAMFVPRRAAGSNYLVSNPTLSFVCDRCGAVATSGAVDLLWVFQPVDGGFECYRALPGRRYGCARHHVESRTYYGHHTVESAGRAGLNGSTCRVFLDGVDITARKVIECDDLAGYVVCVCDEDGHTHVDGEYGELKGLRKYLLRGAVTFVPHVHTTT